MSVSDKATLDNLSISKTTNNPGNRDMGTRCDTSTFECLNSLKNYCCKPPTVEVGYMFWILYISSILCFFFNFVTNIVQLKDYASGDHWRYFGILLFTMIVPQVLINPLTYWWCKDGYANIDSFQNMSCQKRVLLWLFGWWFETYDFGIYAYRVYHREDCKDYYHDVFMRQANIARIRLIYTFLSVGPHLVLEVYQLMNEDWGGSSSGKDIALCCLTLGSIAVSIMTLSMSSKRFRYDNTDVCYAGAAMRILSHFCFLASRVMALVCLFSIDKTAGLVNYVVMVLGYFIIMRYCETSPDPMQTKGRFVIVYQITIALARLYWYTDIADTKSAKMRYMIYFSETCFFAVYCLLGFSFTNRAYLTIGFIIISFFLGILFHLLNHWLFHPASGSLYIPRELLDWELQLARGGDGWKELPLGLPCPPPSPSSKRIT